MSKILDEMDQLESYESGSVAVFPTHEVRPLAPADLPIAGIDADSVVRPVDVGYFLQLMSVGVPLWLGDLAACGIAIGTGLEVARFLAATSHHNLAFTICSLIAYSVCFWSVGLYPGAGLHPARELKQQFRAVLTGTMALISGLLLIGSWRSPYAIAVLISFFLMLISLPICRGIVKSILKSRDIGLPFYFLGRRADVMRAYQDMSRFGWTMLRPAGRFSEASNAWDDALPDVSAEFELKFERQVRYRGTPDVLVPMAKRYQVFRLFVVADDAPEIVADNPKIFNVFPEVVCTRASRSHFCSSSSFVNCGLMSGIKIEEALLLPWPKFVKRSMDLVGATIALLLLSPLLVLLAVLVRISGPGPILFYHTRIGRSGQVFKALKFRSMVSNADQVLADYLADHPEQRNEWDSDHKLKCDPRVTWIGRFMRKTSLDEVPQLWNVFTGDMSLVGPRPIVQAEIVKYGNTFRDYLRVTPGITGLWQISGRNNTTYRERLSYDEFYVRNWSPWLDFYILLRTIKTVLYCEGAY